MQGTAGGRYPGRNPLDCGASAQERYGSSPLPIPTRIVPSAVPAAKTPARVAREFRRLLDEGFRLQPAGRARRRPRLLLSRGYTPKYQVSLFDTTFYLTNIRQNPDVRFFVAYVGQEGSRDLHPRIFYKDVSLIWRSASHLIRSDGENWIGKGGVRVVLDGGVEMEASAEETTDLPVELQQALETLSRRPRRVPRDDEALALVLRRAPDHRLAPYHDFSEPRRRAMADPRNRIYGGRPIARFTRSGDPESLCFARGYEPDFDRGVLERFHCTSRLYGGAVRRFRILSRNRRVQYLFFAAPRQVWIIPPQATTTELSSYGVRTVDVIADEALSIPGYEYHYEDHSQHPPQLHTQIPEGFAGESSEHDPSRADASPWLERLPVVREFRRKLLGRSERRPRVSAASRRAV